MIVTQKSGFVQEQRKFPRYDIEIPASIRLKDGVHYLGKTNNISGNGAYVQYSETDQLQDNSNCILTLYIDGKSYANEIKIKCRLISIRENGVGLEFKTMSTHDFINFVFMLSNRVSDTDRFFSEFTSNPGIDLVDKNIMSF